MKSGSQVSGVLAARIRFSTIIMFVAVAATTVIPHAALAEHQAGTRTLCGDGVRDGEEQCDGNDLGEDTCQTQGFECGLLSCNADCTLNGSGCAYNDCPAASATQCVDSITQQTCGDQGTGCLAWADDYQARTGTTTIVPTIEAARPTLPFS